MPLATRRWAELVGAFMLLTRLPVAAWARGNPAPAACVWAYPLVGCTVGAIGALGFAVAARAGLPPAIAAILAVAAMLAATGALHEDGLADTADGLGGGRGAARKLEIMRDSRIGSFGALSLLLSVGLRVAALATLADPGRVAAALVCAGALGRGAMIVPLLRLRPARGEGLAAPLAAIRPAPAAAGLSLAAIVALALHAAVPLGAAVLAAAAMTHIARGQIGGYTGDVLGATEQVAECAVLVAALTRWS